MSAFNSPPFVLATLGYYSPPADGGKPYQKGVVDPSTGIRSLERNWFPIDVPGIAIENARGREHEVSLDKTGFAFFHHVSKHTSFENEDNVKTAYYLESAELLKKLTGANRVEIFDHTVRKSNLGPGVENLIYGPVSMVHIDQSNDASVARVHLHMPAADVPKLLSKRFQIINLWRPIHHTALDYPLALCDSRSVDPTDIVPVKLIFPDRVGELLSVKHSEKHKWWYLRGMTPDDIVLIKCYDSVQDGSVAVATPHTAFYDPTAPDGAIPRESIELRALVFYD
ncbi:Hydroxylase/desaturase CTB9 [Psilocybe cubensis]|uniref:Methyltransferase n=2 Tax=Psilocybe cubensis TaxID=181762 RepID=A0A8H7Y1F0_PSICU|nr:Hydroxylase/desaturase CTB9 [Psilocybe cubensis]KAH9483451.1 Hydroxylase/desaturase CTB9 [Psilocybe cubensis]